MHVSDLNLHNNCNYNNNNYYYNLNREIKEKALKLDMEEECKPTSSSSSTEAIAAKVVNVDVDVDVEEGEISDAESVEEISEEDFNKQEDQNTVSAAENAKVKDSNNATINLTNNSSINSDNSNSNNQKNAATGAARVWTMRDLYKYQISRNYAPGALYNLAWAQAVQNKPLDEVFIMEYPKSDDNSNKANLMQSGPEVSVNGENERIVIDVDDDVKEEGELEEGEIELDSEVVMSSGDSYLENEVKGDGKGSELEKQVDLIGRGLESVTADDAKKSFGEVCSRLQNLADSLREISLEDSLCEKDKLTQLLMTAIQTVNNVFCSMNQNLKEQKRDNFSRFLDHVTNQKPLLFCPEQLKEVEVMISYLNSLAVSTNIEESDRDKKMDIVGGVNKIDPHVASKNMNQDLTHLKKRDVDSVSVESLYQNGPGMASGHSRSVITNFKQRLVSLPLLDLHKDHDVDSLPSPTREAPSVLPIDRAFGMVHGAIKPEWPVPRGVLEMEKASVHPYETDAVKAVSSYQQKFSRTSFFTSDKLPSPTPSEDGDTGNGDMGGEVTSTSFHSNVYPTSTSVMGQPPASTLPVTSVMGQPPASTLPIVNLPGQGLINAGNFFPVSSGPIPAVRPTIVKTRDPRLRLASLGASTVDINLPSLPVVSTEPRVEPALEMTNSRKQKPEEEPVLDGPAFKRQRNELTDFIIAKDVEALTGTGGWLEDRGTVGLQVSNSNHVPDNVGHDPGRLECAATSIGTGTIAPSVIVKRSENIPMPSPGTTVSLQSLLKDIAVNPSILMNIIKMEQQKSTDPINSSTQPQSSNSILGAVPVSNTVPPKTSALGQKSAGILQTPPQTVTVDESARIRMKRRDPRRVLHGSNIQKGGSIGGDQNKSASSVQRQEDHLVSCHSSTPPDIGRQFMKNLKNIGDIMSVSQAAVVPLVPSTQPAQAYQGRLDEVPSESGNIGSGTTTPLEDVAVGPSRPQGSWGDVDHLFEGFDDKQKAAIQKERARRIEEQRKMFAAGKLCLVLDLDHTLLNSAKFVEVDHTHDEILRKKEEQDREKPQRHLFRFPHMGMWTKLRPGIWSFLEKASKLFELHLYTMGNKLYATEMAKLLDPKGELFAGRVISRGDDGDLIDGDERIPKSKDLEGVLGMESAVVIIDDSVRVWPHNKLNLIVVERYIYFPCSRRQFGLLGPSLLEIDHDERPEDGTLASSLSVIERIHQNFFAHRTLEEADVRNILAAEQRKILAGCRIVFSRVFPVGEANPHLHPLWQTAEQFGAVCTTQIDDQVTHVVANSLGTDKVNWALSTGRCVVHPGWVEASALLYRRANEHDFAVKP